MKSAESTGRANVKSSAASPWDRYCKIRVVGRGAHGVASLCTRVADGEMVVAKEVMMDDMTVSEQEETRNEVQLLSILKHPNIVRYLDSFYAGSGFSAEEPAFVIVMDYASGGNLHDYLLSLTTSLSEHVALALQHIHAHNILHRDLKTHNIFIQEGDLAVNRTIIKLADFGISRLFQRGENVDTTVGTPNYLSPEQCEGKLYNEKSDTWALGCILYEILSRQKLFQGTSIPGIILKIVRGQCNPAVPGYSDSINLLVKSMVSYEPEPRPDMNAVLCEPFLQAAIIDVHLVHNNILIDMAHS